MKKFLVSALAVVMMASLSVAAAAADFNASNAANNPIEIDGFKDAAYVSAPIAVDVAENEESAGGATAQAWMAWDSTYLYMYAEVTDAKVTDPADVTSIWANDSMEIYVNCACTEGSVYEINSAQWTIGPSYTMIAGQGYHRDQNVDNAKYAWEYTDYGYTLEVAIPFGSEYTAAVDGIIWFALAVDDDADDDAATREHHNFTGPNQGGLYNYSDASMDILHLTAEEYVEVVDQPADTTVEDVAGSTEAPQTFDAGVIAAVAAIVSAAGYVVSKKR